MLFVLGQEFYADDDFPNSDFSLATVLGPGKAIVDEIFTKTGAKLEPERRIGRDVKDRLTIPNHLEIIEADLTTIESALPPPLIMPQGDDRIDGEAFARGDIPRGQRHEHEKRSGYWRSSGVGPLGAGGAASPL